MTVRILDNAAESYPAAPTLNPVMVWSLSPSNPPPILWPFQEDYPLPNAGITSSRYSLFTYRLPPVRQVRGSGFSDFVRYRGLPWSGNRRAGGSSFRYGATFATESLDQAQAPILMESSGNVVVRLLVAGYIRRYRQNPHWGADCRDVIRQCKNAVSFFDEWGHHATYWPKQRTGPHPLSYSRAQGHCTGGDRPQRDRQNSPFVGNPHALRLPHRLPVRHCR